MRDRFLYALTTEILRVLIILTLLMIITYVRQEFGGT
jgi:hypothetical protein